LVAIFDDRVQLNLSVHLDNKMKTLIILFWLSVSLVTYGQQKTKPAAEWQPIYFLDSTIVELSQLHFDPDKLAEIKVDGNYYDSAKQIHGKVFITSKQPNSYNFLTIHDIAKTYYNGNYSPIIFILDNDLLKDTLNFKIDSSYVLKIELIKATEIDYLKNTFPNLIILKIVTRTKENIDKQNQIRIR